jgi:hypothetical protein
MDRLPSMSVKSICVGWGISQAGLHRTSGIPIGGGWQDYPTTLGDLHD